VDEDLLGPVEHAAGQYVRVEGVDRQIADAQTAGGAVGGAELGPAEQPGGVRVGGVSGEVGGGAGLAQGAGGEDGQVVGEAQGFVAVVGDVGWRAPRARAACRPGRRGVPRAQVGPGRTAVRPAAARRVGRRAREPGTGCGLGARASVVVRDRGNRQRHLGGGSVVACLLSSPRTVSGASEGPAGMFSAWLSGASDGVLDALGREVEVGGNGLSGGARLHGGGSEGIGAFVEGLSLRVRRSGATALEDAADGGLWLVPAVVGHREWLQPGDHAQGDDEDRARQGQGCGEAVPRPALPGGARVGPARLARIADENTADFPPRVRPGVQAPEHDPSGRSRPAGGDPGLQPVPAVERALVEHGRDRADRSAGTIGAFASVLPGFGRDRDGDGCRDISSRYPARSRVPGSSLSSCSTWNKKPTLRVAGYVPR
jgi:hypothetical protein